MKRVLSALALTIIVLFSGVRAEAQTLYAATGSNGAAGSLYIVDPATGASNVVGPTRFNSATPTCPGPPCDLSMTGLAFHPTTGVLYGVTSDASAGSTVNNLVTINPATAAATFVGVMPNPVGDISFSPSGVLFGWGSSQGAPGLYTVNLADATQTLVAPADFVGGAGNGLTFSLGTLFLAGNAAANVGTPLTNPGATGAFRSVNTATGGTTVLSTLTGAPQPGTAAQPGLISALAATPNRIVFGVNSNNRISAVCDLVSIDPLTGVVTTRGLLPNDTDALAFTNPAVATLYVATGSNGVPGTLYSVDPTTAAATAVGPTQINDVIPVVCPTPPCAIAMTGLAFHPFSHVLFGVTSNSTANGLTILHSLVRIDPATGAATFLGDMGNPVGDITFDGNGTLLGWLAGGSGSQGLVTIDQTSGAQTVVGAPATFPTAGGNGLSFLDTTLYLTTNGASNLNSGGGSTGAFRSVNPATSVTTVVATLTNAPFPGIPGAPPKPAQINSLAGNLNGLFGVNGNTAAPSLAHLITIDPLGGVITDVGALPDDTDGIAFSAGPDVADLLISKHHVGTFTQGQTGATYTITVSSVGSAASSGLVTVADAVPTGLTATSIAGTGWACTQPSGPCTRNDALAVGASYPGLTLTVNVAADAPSSVTNTATVSGGGDANPANNTANDPTTVLTPPDLTITKTHTGSFVQGQSGATYTITVTNAGQAATTGAVSVTDTVPTGLTATAISGTAWVCTQPSGPCTRSDALGGGLSYPALTLTVNVAGDAPSTVTNTATAAGGGEVNAGNDTASDPTTVLTPPDLTITKTHTGSFIQGLSGTYTITVTNAGQAPTTAPVSVTDTIPTGLTATAISGTGWVCTQPAGPCTRSDALGGGLSYPTLTLAVNVAADAPSTVTNTATAAGGGEVNAGNDTASDPTTVLTPPDLTISKTHAGSFVQGQTGATYTITVTNAGQAPTSAAVSVTDAVPAGLTATSIAGTAWTCTQPSGPCTRNDALTTLASYPPLTLTVSVAANAPSTVTNTATAAGGGEVNTANDTASDPTTVLTPPDLTITKTHTGSFIQGLSGTYTITVSNAGQAPTSAAVSVTDAVPAGLTATSIAGGGWTCTQPSGPCTRNDALPTLASYPALTLTVSVAANAPSTVTNTATAAGGGEVNTANDTASDPTTVLTPPDLTITKTHTGNFVQGQTGKTYAITVSNAGQAPTSATVSVTDAVPAGLTATAIAGTGWTCTQPSGPCTRNDVLTTLASYPALTLTVDVAANAPASVTNSATVSGGGEVNTANDTANDPTTVLTPPDLTITKTHTVTFFQGRNGATYTITVGNAGQTPTSGLVTVAEAVPAGLTATAFTGTGWSCTQPAGPCTRSDALGASLNYPALTLTVSVAANAPASVTNVATVSGGGEANTANDTASDPTTVVPGPDLLITKTHVGNFVQGQNGVKYTITVRNVGGTTSSGLITVADTMPAGLTAVSISSTSAGWTCTQPAGPCTNPNLLGPGLSFLPITLTVNVNANAPASLTNTATVSGGGDVNPANNTVNDPTTVLTPPDLTIAKTHTGNFVQGQTGKTYTISVANAGQTATSGLVTVTDAVPAGLTATAISGSGWTCTQPSGPCSRTNTLASLASYPALTLTVSVAANAPASVTNTATVSGGGEANTANDTANDPTTIGGGADLTITKTHTGTFVQGQTGAKYTITVTNVGAVTSSGLITVADAVPTGLTAVSISSTSAGWTCTQPSGPCTNPNLLGPGLSFLPITLTVNVNANAPASLTNTATVSGGGDVNPANNTANDPTTVLTPPDLTITKTHAGSFFQGQTGATYTITATNSGGTPTSGTVTVTDAVPTGLTATAIVGTGWTCTQPSGPCSRANALASLASYPALTLTVSVAANAPASVTNTATVSGGGEVNTANDTANDPTTITGGPDPTIAKTHVNNFFQGKTGATYSITVTNAGSSPTVGTVTVADAVPTGLTATAITGTGWTCTQPSGPCSRNDALASLASYPALTLTVSVAANAPASVTNTATVSGGGDVNPANNSANDPTTIAAGPDLTITKTHTGNFVQGQAGAKYTIMVTNSGGTTSSGLITVADTLPAGLTPVSISSTSAGWTCTQPAGPCTNPNLLGAGLSFLPITLTVNVDANAPASLTNTATVSGGGDVNPANNTANDPTTVLTPPDLTITKTHAGSFFQGQTGATYTITVANSGGTTTSGTVTMTDAVPTGLTATAIAGTGWTCTQPSGPCSRTTALASLASYPALTLTVNVAANAASPLVNSATVSGGGEANTANDTANDSTTILAPPDLTITKTHTGNFFQGQTAGAAYAITVTNSGVAATSGLVTVTDAVPTGLTATAITGTGWTCTQPSGPCTRSDALASLASYPALTLTVTVAANAPASVTNVATVAGGSEGNLANDTASDPTTIAVGRDLAITKTHVGNFSHGQIGAKYTITVTNVGGTTTSGLITVTDTLPAGLTATSISSTSAGWTCTQPSGPCTNPNLLGPGLSFLPITLTVNVSAGAPASVTNTVTVSGGGDVNPANNTANDVTTINP